MNALSQTHALPAETSPQRVRRPRLLRHSRSGMAGLLVLLVFGALALGVALGAWGQDWSAADGGRWEAAGSTYWFGTNALGQDIFQRSLFSVRVAFEIGMVVALASTFLGACSGAVAGWYAHGWVDAAVVYCTGVLDSIPFYLFVVAVAYAMQGSPWAIHIAMVASFWTATSRLVRAEVLRLKQREFVQAAMAMGVPVPALLLRHVLPNTVPILLAQFSITFVAAIKAEVVLSFLGLGQHDGVSWGLMLAESTQEILSGHFGNLLAAAVPLFVLLLGVNLLADALQDVRDPRQGMA